MLGEELSCSPPNGGFIAIVVSLLQKDEVDLKLS
jgi:hypothetical protein